jgi:hypothetical protein
MAYGTSDLAQLAVRQGIQTCRSRLHGARREPTKATRRKKLWERGLLRTVIRADGGAAFLLWLNGSCQVASRAGEAPWRRALSFGRARCMPAADSVDRVAAA